MKKSILGLMVFLVIGSAFALGEGLGQLHYDPEIKTHGTLEPTNEPTHKSTGVKRNHCNLMEETCDWRLKYLDSETIKVGKERFYLRYLGDNKVFVTNGQYKWTNPLRYEGITEITDEGTITLGNHETNYIRETTDWRDKITLTL